MRRAFDLSEDSKIFVVCPANNKTGGTELLHQLVYHLRVLGKIAYIAYYMEGNSDKHNPTPEDFKKYVDKICFVKDIEDDSKNILVLPEVCIGKHRKFNKIQKSVWWLSVDNYGATLGKFNRLKRYGIKSFLKHLWLNDDSNEADLHKIGVHLYQSFFAADFINSKGIEKGKTWYLSDYINDIYNVDFDENIKEDIVIYNPKKGYEFTQKLIAAAPDVRWIPIQNMTNIQVQDLMCRAKVYIDFGNHPGKDRIPREAAMSGCCVVTCKRGSAAYERDVPIKEKFKFEDVVGNIPSIIETLRSCIVNYSEIITEYSEYRNFIRNEKAKFQDDVRDIFS